MSMLTRISFCILATLLLTSCGSAPTSDQTTSTGESSKKIDANPKPSIFRGEEIVRPGGQLYSPTPTLDLDLPPSLASSQSEESEEENVAKYQATYRVLPPIQGARVKRNDGKQWLEVDFEIEEAWNILLLFWSSSGVGLVNQNRELGLMETQWIQEPKDVEEAGNIGQQLFRELTTSLTQQRTVLHRYQLRFERLTEKSTAIHASHRQVARKDKSQAKKVKKFEWVDLPSDYERVADFLQNIILLFKDNSAASS